MPIAFSAGKQSPYSKTTTVHAITIATGIPGAGALSAILYAAPMSTTEKVPASALIGGTSPPDTSSMLAIN